MITKICTKCKKEKTLKELDLKVFSEFVLDGKVCKECYKKEIPMGGIVGEHTGGNPVVNIKRNGWEVTGDN